jgi:chalcone isomerase-like protein
LRAKTVSIASTLMLLAMGGVQARELKGVQIPEQVSIAGRECKLNGAGVLEWMLFSIYAAGAWLEKPTQNAEAALASDQIKRIEATYFVNAPGKDLMNGLRKELEKQPEAVRQAQHANHERFLGFFADGIRTGGSMRITYVPGQGTEVALNGDVKGVIEGRDFMESVFAIWLGPQPTTEQIKRALLGGPD